MRLFVAVNLPEEVRHAAWVAAGALRTTHFPIRWVAQDALHVTLKFLGEVPAEREEEIVAALHRAAAGARPFTLMVTGFGAFPSVARPRVVWIGCERAPALELLQHRVEQEMAQIGFPLEGRPFHPHITLGRVKGATRSRDLAGFVDIIEPLEYATEIAVPSIDLMQSVLSRRGATYTRRHATPLEG
jgi:2'-5' RNA ligase